MTTFYTSQMYFNFYFKERNDTDTDSDSFEARTPSPQMDSYVLPESSIDPLQQKIDQVTQCYTFLS